MRKIQIFLLAVVFCVVPQLSVAASLPVNAGDVVDYASSAGGGAANISVGGSEYDVFCIQYGVPIDNGAYTVAGVGAIDLNEDIKWLYAAFSDGAFGNIGLGNTTYPFSGIADLVQHGIWYHTDRTTSGVSDAALNKMTEAWTILETKKSDYVWDDHKGEWTISSVTFEEMNPDGTNAQAQVIGVRDNPAEVPEPVTMVLFGLGLMGVAGVVRRRVGNRK